jgi:hypothetical protein
MRVIKFVSFDSYHAFGSNMSHLYSKRNVIQKSKVKKITPKKYETKEFSFLCLPILNYCIHTYHSSFKPDGVAKASQIFL